MLSTPCQLRAGQAVVSLENRICCFWFPLYHQLCPHWWLNPRTKRFLSSTQLVWQPCLVLSCTPVSCSCFLSGLSQGYTAVRCQRGDWDPPRQAATPLGREKLRDERLQIPLNDSSYRQLYPIICFSQHFNSIFKGLEHQEITTYGPTPQHYWLQGTKADLDDLSIRTCSSKTWISILQVNSKTGPPTATAEMMCCITRSLPALNMPWV